jgi:hypothetical protein
MASVNKVIVVGNLGRDPEMRTFPSGDQVANVTEATTDRWKDKQSGEMRETVLFREKKILSIKPSLCVSLCGKKTEQLDLSSPLLVQCYNDLEYHKRTRCLFEESTDV